MISIEKVCDLSTDIRALAQALEEAPGVVCDLTDQATFADMTVLVQALEWAAEIGGRARGLLVRIEAAR